MWGLYMPSAYGDMELSTVLVKYTRIIPDDLDVNDWAEACVVATSSVVQTHKKEKIVVAVFLLMILKKATDIGNINPSG